MPLTFVISGPLRELAGNRDEVRIERSAQSVSDALSLLWSECPSFRDRVITELGELRPHLNIFVDGENIRWSGGFATPVRDGAEIVILPALSGG
jgi:molybdopterin synthase sulfur carrier subunit